MSWITEKWATMPTVTKAPRLENHLIHMFAGIVLVGLSILIASAVEGFETNIYKIGHIWYISASVVSLLAVVREFEQMYREKEVAWVAVFDMWQWSFHWVFYPIIVGAWWATLILFALYAGAYLVFLRFDDEWFHQSVLKRELELVTRQK